MSSGDIRKVRDLIVTCAIYDLFAERHIGQGILEIRNVSASGSHHLGGWTPWGERSNGWLAVLTACGHGGIGRHGHGGDRTADQAAGVASIQPANGAVVGVAHPVIVTFTAPVTNRAAAERAIKITAPNHMTGRFDWVDTNVVQWKPDGYWPAHSHVGVEVHALSTGFDTVTRW